MKAVVVVGFMVLATFMAPRRAMAFKDIPHEDFAREIREATYFSDGPALFATFCASDACQTVAAGSPTVDHGSTVDPRSLFTIGSNSKFVTAILVLKLVGEGYFGLDDKLVDFFPEYDRWQGVTVRNLLGQSSGIPDYIFTRDGTNRILRSIFSWHTRHWRPQDLLNLVKGQPSLFPAGTKVEYNNTNFILLGMIAEKATGARLGDLLRQEIFVPLGMTSTYLELPRELRDRRIPGYMRGQLPLPGWLVNLLSFKVEAKGPFLDTSKIFDSTFTWAAGGMVSSIDDLAKLTRALFHGQLIKPELLDEMQAFRQGTVLGMPLTYGLGLMKLPTVLGDGLGHGGLSPGYQVLNNYFKDQDVVFTMAQNLGPSQLYGIYLDLLPRLLHLDEQVAFVEDPTVAVKALDADAAHIRLRGVITAAPEPQNVFGESYGFAVVKDRRAKNSQPFTAFHAYQGSDSTAKRLTVRASVARVPLAPAPKPGFDAPFVEIWFDRSALADSAVNVLKSRGTGVFFAFKGLSGVDARGGKQACISEIIDSGRDSYVQLQEYQGEGFQERASIKLAANIRFKAFDPEEAADGDLPPLTLPACNAVR